MTKNKTYSKELVLAPFKISWECFFIEILLAH
jgi:hypothetical protein